MRSTFSQTLTERVLDRVHAERVRQIEKWGHQHHPDFAGNLKNNPLQRVNLHNLKYPDHYKAACDLAFENDKGTWAHIFMEEVGEVFGTRTKEELSEELIQVAAVCVSWVEDLDTREETNDEEENKETKEADGS